jgi:hypothetical protein
MSDLTVSAHNGFVGGSWHGTSITTTPRKLVTLAKKVGAQHYIDNSGDDKTNFNFEFANSKGEGFTVYDWKEYRPLGMDERIEFNIGGHNKMITMQSKEDLQTALNSL